MEQLSALMDGELDDEQAERTLQGIRSNDAAMETWTHFHLIGDAIRGEGVATPTLSERVLAALEAEPTVLAPSRPKAARHTNRFAWPIAASAAGVAVVAWLALAGHQPKPGDVGPVVKNDISTTPVVPDRPSMPDAVVADYMNAHQRYSPTSAMPGSVAPMIRTVRASGSDLAR